MKKFLALFCVLFLLAGCASAAHQASSSSAYYAPSSNNMKEDYAAGAAEAPYADADYSEGFSVVEEDSSEKLVYTGSVRLESREYDEFTAELSSLVKSYNGIIQSMQEYGNTSSRRHLNLTVRIPAKQFDDFLNALRSSSASVAEISTYVDNITRQYYD